ncbi:hypothetical protein GVAV_002996 [Gurleya vavrai]
MFNKKNTEETESAGMYVFYEESLKYIKDYIKMTIIKNTSTKIETSTINTSAQDNLSVSSSPSKKFNFRQKPKGNKIENSYQMLEKYLNAQKNQTEQFILLENLRFLILKTLKIVNKSEKAKLKYYHSVIHLLQLTNKKELPYHLVLNDWLNINYASNDLVIDAMRGNFGRLIKKYPEFLEPVENLLQEKIDEENKDNSNSEKKKNLFNVFIDFFHLTGKKEKNPFLENWCLKFKNKIPKNIFDVIKNRKNVDKQKWAEILCYDLIYTHRKEGKFVDSISDIKKIIDIENIFTDIITEKYQNAFEKADEWLKLIIFLVSNSSIENKFIEEVFDCIGRKIYKTDYKLALEYFSFTKNSNLYFNFILGQLDLNFINVFVMYNFADENCLDKERVLALFCEQLLSIKDFYRILNVMNQYQYKFEGIKKFDEQFVDFCILNFNQVERHFDRILLDANIYDFVLIYCKFKNENFLEKEEFLSILDNKYSCKYFKDILECFVKIKHDETTLLHVLEKIIEKNDDDLIFYKRKILEQFNCAK